MSSRKKKPRRLTHGMLERLRSPAVRHGLPLNPILKTFYQHLRARGKPAKVALTAVMRKLVILLNRLLKNPDFQLVS